MATPSYPPRYPIRVDAHLDPQLSRGLWLVKWLLAIPHYVVLAFLWMAFVVMSVAALFAILVTGRYPRPIFDFNVGVLRWSWRVAYYTYGALATDRYPPFSLSEDPDYPAHLDVEYPEHLSRGLALVKWWLLALPHYLIVGIFVSGGFYLARAAGPDIGAGPGGTANAWDSGLIGLLVLFAGMALLFTGTYPRQLYDLILGLNRWVLRVAAYASLMTDQYPPFRLDQGGEDPGAAVALPSTPASPATAMAGSDRSDDSASQRTTAHPRPDQRGAQTSRWGAGRVISVVLASLLMLFSFGLLAAGSATAVAGSTMRDSGGFLMTDVSQLSTDTYALRSPAVEVHGPGIVGTMPHRMLGDVKVRVTTSNGKPLFVGLASTRDAHAYLAGVRHATVYGGDGQPAYRVSGGQAPMSPPGHSETWVAMASGTGTQSVVAPVTGGSWTVVVMNADGSAGVDAALSVGATAPGLGVVTVVLLSLGGVLLVAALVVLVVAVRGASPRPQSER